MKRKTIRNHKDFLTSSDDLSIRAAYFLVKTKFAKYPQDPRYGIIASKRTFRHAVDRNRAKRLLRDWIGANEKKMLKDMDYIFIAGKDILNATRDKGRSAMRRALKIVEKYHKINAVY